MEILMLTFLTSDSYWLIFVLRSRDNSVGIVTRLHVGRPLNYGSTPGSDKKRIFSSKNLDQA